MANVYIDALAGVSWTSLGYSNHITYFFDNTGGLVWTAVEKAAYVSAIRSWADVANITVAEAGSAGSARLVESLVTTAFLEGQYGSGVVGVHDTPDINTAGQVFGAFAGDLSALHPFALNAAAVNPGSFQYATLVHEIGHALGLAHPHDTGMGTTIFPGVTGDFSVGTGGLNQDVYTIMSYNEYLNPPVGRGHAAGPMAFDIAAIQQLYGANMSFHAGNDNYSLNSVVSPESNPALGMPRWLCIWDGGGTDSLSYSGNASVWLDLRAATLQPGRGAGGFLSHRIGDYGGYTIANNVTIENATASSGNDTIVGNNANNFENGGAGNDLLLGGLGNDRLFGVSGNDTLVGGGGRDYLVGGIGADIYRFDRLSDTGPDAATRDVVADFQHSIDKLDLSRLDANTLVALDQKFIFDGTAPLSAAAGHVHYFEVDQPVAANDRTIVEGDVDGNGVADFQIELVGLIHLTSGDFIL